MSVSKKKEMQLNRCLWFILLILLLCRIAECDEEKIKRAIYSYQPSSKEQQQQHHEKSNINHFEKFQGASPFEQVLAALGISGKSQSNIQTTVEYWPPDMDREKFYQMNQGGGLFPFVSWNYEPNLSLKKTTLLLEHEQKQPIVKLKALKEKPEKVYNSPEVRGFSASYPSYEEPKKIVTTKQPEFKWIEKATKAPKIKIKEKIPDELPKTLKMAPQYFNSKYHQTPVYEVNEEAPIYEEIPPIKIITTPKIIEDYYRIPETSSPKPKSSHPKFYIHTSKLPAQPESPTSQVDITSSTEDSFIFINDASVTDSGPVVFPQSTPTTTSTTATTRNDFQRGINIKEIFVPHKQKQQLHHRQHHEHEHVLEVKNQDLQQSPPRVNKRRKLKKKVKTSSIAQEVVNIGNRGSSGTQPPPIPFYVDTIAPQTSTDVAVAVVNSYVDPKYSDIIDKLSKLTEQSYNLNSHYNTGMDDNFNNNTESIYSSSLKESPTTETYYDYLKPNKNSSVHDDNVMIVLNMMRNSSSNISSSSVEELKKAVIDNDLPKVKRIVKHHMEKKQPVSDASSSSTTEVSVTRAKISRSRFGIKAKTNQVTTENVPLNSTTSSTIKPKIRKPVSATARQVISTTKSSSRHNNRTRPSTTPRATTSRSTKSIARRITTRKSIKSTTLSS